MKDDRVYLQHIRDALQDIDAYCGTDHDVFLSDRMRQDATLRKLEIIGQAVKNLSEPTVVQRTSSDLRLNPHLHTIAVDGASPCS